MMKPKIQRIAPLRVLLFRENDWWVAQGIEWDLAAQGRTVGETWNRFLTTFVTQLCLCLERNLDPRVKMIPAPAVYREMFEQALKLEKPPSYKIPATGLPEPWMIDAMKKAQVRISA